MLEALASRRGATGISELSQLGGAAREHRAPPARDLGRPRLRAARSGKFALSSRLAAYLRSPAPPTCISTCGLVARPYLERLMRNSGETANLVTASDGEVVYLDQVASMHLVKMFTSPGMRAPLYCTGSGKAMLAFGPASGDRTRAARHRSSAARPRRSSTRAALEEELARNPRDAVSRSTTKRWKKACAASPSRSSTGAATSPERISVSGPTTRFDARARRAALAGRSGPGRRTVRAARLPGGRSPIAQRFAE